VYVLARSSQSRFTRALIMKDITENMLRFKEATRHVWNTYLLGSAHVMLPDIQNSFALIESELLCVIVLLPFDAAHLVENYRKIPLPIIIKPEVGLREIPVQFGTKDQVGNMIWQQTSSVNANDLQNFKFVEFFDWNPYGYIDMSFVKIYSSEAGWALVPNRYCRFSLDI